MYYEISSVTIIWNLQLAILFNDVAWITANTDLPRDVEWQFREIYNSNENEFFFNVKKMRVSPQLFSDDSRCGTGVCLEKDLAVLEAADAREAHLLEAAARPRETGEIQAEYFSSISGIRVNIWPRHGAGHHRDIHCESGRVPNLPQRSGVSPFLLSDIQLPETIESRNIIPLIQNRLIILANISYLYSYIKLANTSLRI